MSFELKYVLKEGKNVKDSFLKSFFLAKEGPGAMRVVKASDIVPAEIQKLVFAGKETEVAEPEAICEGIKKECGATFAGFLKWVAAHKDAVKAEIKRIATSGDKDFDYANWAINEREVPKQDASADGRPTYANSEEEAKANKDLADKPAPLPGHGKKIKDQFNRLPDAGGVGEPTKAIDVKSKALSGPLRMMREALRDKEEALKKAEAAEKKAAELEDKLKKKAEEEVQQQKASDIDSILHELQEMGFQEADLEATRKDLANASDEALKVARELIERIEALSRAGKPNEGMPMPEGTYASKTASEEEGDVPPVILPNDKTRQANTVDTFSQLWAADTLARSSNQ